MNRLLIASLWLVGVLSAVAPGSGSADEIVLRGAGLFDQGVIPAHVQADMRRLPQPARWRAGDPIKEIPQRKGVPRDHIAPETARQPRGGDPLRMLNNRAPASSGGRVFDRPLLNQNGAGFTGVNPPDPVGDVGTGHYVQMVNGPGFIGGTQVLIVDKADGQEVANFALGDLAVGSGTGCTDGRGDPIVMFDSTVENGAGESPGRWFLSEFTLVSLCIYISDTADPTEGGWSIYEFFSDSGELPDYPKYGVWPDAYYIGANEDGDTFGTPGRMVYALDRENMLQGAPTRPTQVFEAPLLAGFAFQTLQPADWDGATPPPLGAPGIFVRHRDDEVHNGGSADPERDFLELWTFSVDWDTPANSTFSGPTNVEVADFESELCGLTSFACVPQPDSERLLDPLREPVMWRAQYRNFGTHQVIVGSWVTDVVGGSADIHGVRWAELRDVGSGWTMHQQGTVSPDDVHRWMPSIAMDGAGNLAVGYNVSDAVSVFPGLRYTGRLASDPLDTMPIAEVTLVDGSDANVANRYGDYSSMNVDPADECTFWFTGQYNPTSQWSTRIAKFRFNACGDPNFTFRGAPVELEACVADGDVTLPDVTLEIGSFDGFSEDVALAFEPLPVDFEGAIDPAVVTPAQPAAQAVADITVLSTASSGDYDITITGTAAGVEPQSVALAVSVTDAVPPVPTLQSPGNGATAVVLEPLFEWSAADQANSYLFELATDSSFNNVVASQIGADTAFQASFELDPETGYFWRVSPSNQCGTGAIASAAFTTGVAPGACASGTREVRYFADDMESGENGWTHAAADAPDTWTLQSLDSNSPDSSWRASSVTEISDQRLVSPQIVLPEDATSSTLQFFTEFSIEESTSGCFDAAVIEYSQDDGVSWQPNSAVAVLDNPYTGTVENNAGNPLADRPGWCGIQDWTRTAVDLRGLEGSNLRFRFRLGTDEAFAQGDWLIDDVVVQSCEPEYIFSDGFED
ncbi:MAG: hypothetical protein WD397_08460 [Wenzhouxiangellaceae bacterium]